MQNETLRNAARQILKDLLAQLNEPQRLLFKRMYAHKSLHLSINDAVDQMDPEEMDHAISQCERSISKGEKNE